MTLKAPGPRASCSSLSWSARYYIAGACKQCGAHRRRRHSACSRHCRRRRRRRRCCSPRSFFLSSLEWLCKCSSRDARWPLPSPHSTVSKDIRSQWNANYMSMNVFSELFVNCLLGDAYWKHPSIDFREGKGDPKLPSQLLDIID